MRFILILFSVSFFLLKSVCVGQKTNEWTLPPIVEPVFKKDTFNILKYGAKNDGISLNTRFIQNAIIDCNAKGGGVVLIPEGIWLTGPLELKSNVNLNLMKNALLVFTNDKTQYALKESNWEGLPSVRNQSPLAGDYLENIAITGKGIIDGNGDSWRAVKKDKLTETQWRKLLSSGGLVSEDGKTWYPSAQFMNAAKLESPGVLTNGKTMKDYIAYKDFFRPNLLVLNNCKKVLLQGPTFQNSAAWGLHSLMCTDLTVRDVYVKNPWYAQNGDGIDIESCSNVLIENSTFDVGDDGICVKSGRDEEGRKRGMSTQNLIVRNCTVYHAHGGFVIGSEMSGGVRNIFIENCTFIGTDIGLRFKTKRGRGGMVENVFIRKIAMKDIVGEAILFDMYYMARDPIVLTGEKRESHKVEVFPVTEATPRFRNFRINEVVCQGAERAIFIRGLPEMSISDLFFQDLIIEAGKGIEIMEGKNIGFKNVQVVLKDTNPVVKINNSSRIYFDDFKYGNEPDLLFNVIGEKCEDIFLTNSDTSNVKNKIESTSGARKKALVIK